MKQPPKEFFQRRLHSLLGLWLVLFLFEHLLTNSEAALFIGADGEGFVTMVNFIHSLPYLEVIEVAFIALPLLYHGILGVKYLLTMKQNAYVLSEGLPSLPEYPRNQAYTWQRITSWILIPLILFHVIQMRFIHYPETIHVGSEKYYTVKINEDEGYKTLAPRIGLEIRKDGDETLAISKDIGTAFLMNVRETFKSPLMIAIYTVFVCAAVFHACNGIWTFAVTWGLPLSMRGQKIVKRFALFVMALLAFFGLSAVWGSYLINLRY